MKTITKIPSLNVSLLIGIAGLIVLHYPANPIFKHIEKPVEIAPDTIYLVNDTYAYLRIHDDQ